MIDGGGLRPYGVVVIADGVRVENLTVTGATFYGVLFTGLHDANGPSAQTADGYHAVGPDQVPAAAALPGRPRHRPQQRPVRHLRVQRPARRDHRLLRLRVGGQRHLRRPVHATCDILVSGNVAERNAVGFENANASDSVVVTGNRFSNNRVGLTLLSSYQEAFTPQRKNQVVGNLISDNNESDAPVAGRRRVRHRHRHQRRRDEHHRTQPDHRPPARRRGAGQHRGPAGHEEHASPATSSTTTPSIWRTSRPRGRRPPATAPTTPRRPRRRRCWPSCDRPAPAAGTAKQSAEPTAGRPGCAARTELQEGRRARPTNLRCRSPAPTSHTAAGHGRHARPVDAVTVPAADLLRVECGQPVTLAGAAVLGRPAAPRIVRVLAAARRLLGDPAPAGRAAAARSPPRRASCWQPSDSTTSTPGPDRSAPSSPRRAPTCICKGWIDYASHLGYAQVTGSFTPQALLWNGKTVGVHDSRARCRRQPGAAHPRPGRPGLGQPSAGRHRRPGSMRC